MKIISVKLGVVMCYLIPFDGKYLLIDTGYERNKKLFYKKLSDMNIKLKNISIVLLTHHHDDHASLAYEIKKLNPQCRFILHEKAIKLLEKGINNPDLNFRCINKRVKVFMEIFKIFNKKFSSNFSSFKVRENDIIIKNDVLLKDIGVNISGKILCTPGHTSDSISLLLNSGECFSGDATSNMLRSLGTKYCTVFLTDFEEYYDSWRKLIKEGVKILYPGHGNCYDVEKLKKNIDFYGIKKKNDI